CVHLLLLAASADFAVFLKFCQRVGKLLFPGSVAILEFLDRAVVAAVVQLQTFRSNPAAACSCGDGGVARSEKIAGESSQTPRSAFFRTDGKVRGVGIR